MESKDCTERSASYCREDEDEEKMEKFFALLRNIRNQLQENNNKRKRATSGGGWAPAFQWEDFTSEIEFKKHVPIFPNPCNNNGKQDSKNPVEPTSSPNLNLTL
ncbi:hypothetical protein Pfo_006021 [Paulownia fortunei]|nr:hypothetical protein Pfo_006021 [Paulownia fortunei]